MFPNITKKISSKTKYMICIVIILIVLALCGYCISCLSKSKKTEGFNSDYSDKTLMFFRADWCGHCTRFKPVWDDFKEECKQKYPNVELSELNIDEEASKPLMEKHNVRGFPHVVLVGKDVEDVVFTKNRTKEDLLAFIQEQM
jgi:thiol-disulfide isomerase/thioredoxin